MGWNASICVCMCACVRCDMNETFNDRFFFLATHNEKRRVINHIQPDTTGACHWSGCIKSPVTLYMQNQIRYAVSVGRFRINLKHHFRSSLSNTDFSKFYCTGFVLVSAFLNNRVILMCALVVFLKTLNGLLRSTIRLSILYHWISKRTALNSCC